MAEGKITSVEEVFERNDRISYKVHNTITKDPIIIKRCRDRYQNFEIVADSNHIRLSGLEGTYLSKGAALKALGVWIGEQKPTQARKTHDLFGDKQPPVLKRKTVRKRPNVKSTVPSAEDSDQPNEGVDN